MFYQSIQKILNYRLELIVFLGGAIGMILEMVGSRVVSPYFGNSLIVWTSLIGVVLGCLSSGYYFGGKLADKNPSYNGLSYLLFLGSFTLGVSAFIKEPLLALFQHMFGGDLRAGSFISVLVLFGPVSVILGMIAPFAAKLRLDSVTSAGKTVGNLYALSTFGSITGTFLAGFFLIPRFGNSNLMYGLALAVLALSVISSAASKKHHMSLVLFLMFAYFFNRSSGLMSLNVIDDIDSEYNRIVVRGYQDVNQNYLLGIGIDNAGVQSLIIPNRPDELYLNYVRAYRASDEINSRINNALVIGGGGFSYPREFLRTHLSATIDVVEIDPEMTRVARKYFFLKDDLRLNIIHQDARTFINESSEKYDVIFLDAFTSITPPSHLTTLEFMTKLRNHLSEDGFLMVNMLSSLEVNNSGFLNAERKTLQEVFPKVDIYQLDNLPKDKVQNLMVVAYKKEIGRSLSLGKPLEFSDKNQASVLTDDWAPVEFLTRNYY